MISAPTITALKTTAETRNLNFLGGQLYRATHALPWGAGLTYYIFDGVIIIGSHGDIDPYTLVSQGFQRARRTFYGTVQDVQDVLRVEWVGDTWDWAPTPTREIPYWQVRALSSSMSLAARLTQFEVTVPSAPEITPKRIMLAAELPESGTITLGEYPRFKVDGTFLGKSYSLQLSWDRGRIMSGDARLNVFDHLNLSDFSKTPREDVIAHSRVLDEDEYRDYSLKGLASMAGKKDIAPNLARLEQEEPALYEIWGSIIDCRTQGKVSNNQMLAVFLDSHGRSYETLVQGLRDTARGDWYKREMLAYTYEGANARRFCEALPGVAAWLKTRLVTKQTQAAAYAEASQAKVVDLLEIDTVKCPRLARAIEKGDIPKGTFFQPGGEQPVNREFEIWERALSRKGWAKPLFEICQNASRRTTYERDIVPYLNFLFKIEAYLDRHTTGRKKWSALPKFVQSQWELEMDDDGDANGTVKRRSALTPDVDNEGRTITVPYTAMSVSGAYTTWCYSRFYYLFEEGMTDPESGGIVVRDLELALNGKDDYGLMYYTLSGTSTNRGYPTFLIIFERRSGGTHVHFHRVHPCRSKNKVLTPACKLIEATYQYMAGNIPASEVVAQQGDLIFLHAGQLGKAIKAPVKVLEFESHRFVAKDGPPLVLFESTASQPRNRLGYLQSDVPFAVRHPEHDDIEELPAGTYEVRRCRSYENNPVAQWSRFVD